MGLDYFSFNIVTLHVRPTRDEIVLGFETRSLLLTTGEDHDEARPFRQVIGRSIAAAKVGVVFVVGVEHLLAAQVQLQEAVRTSGKTNVAWLTNAYRKMKIDQEILAHEVFDLLIYL